MFLNKYHIFKNYHKKVTPDKATCRGFFISYPIGEEWTRIGCEWSIRESNPSVEYSSKAFYMFRSRFSNLPK